MIHSQKEHFHYTNRDLLYDSSEIHVDHHGENMDQYDGFNNQTQQAMSKVKYDRENKNNQHVLPTSIKK